MRLKALAEIYTMNKYDFRAVQRSAFCRSRRELSNAHFLAKFGFDAAENEPCKVCPIEHCNLAHRDLRCNVVRLRVEVVQLPGGAAQALGGVVEGLRAPRHGLGAAARRL